MWEGGEEEGGQEGPVCSLRLVLPSNGTAPRASATPEGPLVAEVKAPAQLHSTGHTGQRRGGVGALRGEEDTAVWLVQQVQQQLDAAVTRMEAVVAASEQRMLGRIEALHARLAAVASDNHTASPKPSQYVSFGGGGRGQCLLFIRSLVGQCSFVQRKSSNTRTYATNA